MKKIININLSGRVIPIEDGAYESLQRYIESLRRYFAAEESRDEIINDIESRIAELMNDKVRKGADAVSEADVTEIITTMGRVEDFEQADAVENAPAGSGQTFSNTHTATGGAKRFRGRLYRDLSDKVLGGVCGGVAYYMNVDPAIVRLLFIIITFGGFGAGFFLYILLWILVPARSLEGFAGKRLFRNPEDRIFGGVAGGLGAYFNREPWIFCAVFAGPLVLNILFGIFNGLFNHDMFPNFLIGSFTGTFILIYIVLWIVLPEARSPFEKMEMRGEKVDVNRIWQNVQQNMSGFEGKAQAWGEEVKTTANQWGSRATEFANTRGRSVAAEMGQTGRTVARSIGQIIVMLFKVFFFFVFGSIAIALFFMVVVFAAGGLTQPVNDFLLDGFWERFFLWGTLVFFLAVPLIAIITWIVRRLMKVRSQKRYLGWTFGGLWTLGWISLICFSALVAKDFRNYDRIAQNVPVAQPAMNELTVRVNEPRIRYSGTFDWVNDDNNNDGGWDLTEDSLLMANVNIRVQKSADSFYHVTLWKYSRGRNRADAAARAERVTYTVSSLDSALVLGSGFGVYKAQKFRGQRVNVEIKMPVGKRIRFDESVQDKLRGPVHVRSSGSGRWNNNNWEEDWEEDNYYFQWQPGITYIMTETGELVDVTKKPDVDTNGGYEYKRGQAIDSQIQDLQRQRNEENDRLNQRIEEQRRKVEEENRRLEELQNNQRERNENGNTGRVDFEKTKKSTLETTGIHTPVFSLII